MNKKAIAILGAIFILIIGTLGYLIFRRSADKPETEVTVITDNPEPTGTESEPTPTGEESGKGRAIRLTDDQVITPVLFFKGTGISYFNRQGQLFQTDLQTSGSNVLLSNKRELAIALKANITRALWPSVGNSFIAEFASGSKKTWSYYDSIKVAYTDIPPQVFSLDWMPTGDKIMFVWVDANNKATLNISNPDTTGYQMLTEFYEPDNIISVAPDGRNVLFYRMQTADLTANTINLVSADGKTFRSIIKDGYNKGVKWSPDSGKFLFNKRGADGKFALWMADISTGEIRNLGVNTTATKAIWTKDSKTVYAAVPSKGVADQGLTEDIINKIDISSLNKDEVDPGVAVDGQEMFLNLAEDTLFFRNAQDGSLYYMLLK